MINTVGDTTDYQVCLRQDLKDKLDAAFNTTLTAGTNVTITPTIDANGNIDYLIDVGITGNVHGKASITDLDLIDDTVSLATPATLVSVGLPAGIYHVEFDGYIENDPGNAYHIEYALYNETTNTQLPDSYRQIGEPITGSKVETFGPVVTSDEVTVAAGNVIGLRTNAIVNPGQTNNTTELKKGILRWTQVG